MNGFTKSELEQLTGISQRKIQFLIDYEIIDPAQRGRGKPTIFDEINLIEILMAKVLRDRQVGNMTIMFAFGLLRRTIRETPGHADFFTNDKWGNTDDIVYYEAPIYNVGLGNQNTAIDSVGPDYIISEKIIDYIFRKASGPVTSIPLGKVKIEAMSRLNK